MKKHTWKQNLKCLVNLEGVIAVENWAELPCHGQQFLNWPKTKNKEKITCLEIRLLGWTWDGTSGRAFNGLPILQSLGFTVNKDSNRMLQLPEPHSTLGFISETV